MLFCKVQEYYESPYKSIRNKHFTLLEFMELYTKKVGDGIFTYPQDWGGFNFPSEIARKCLFFAKETTIYDKILKNIYRKCQKLANNQTFYIIGVDKVKSGIMDHEIAHGMYYTDAIYKSKSDSLTSSLPEKTKKYLTDYLLSIGYTKEVIDDEIQAYMSTGLPPDVKKSKFKGYLKDYKKLYKKYKPATQIQKIR